MMLLIPSTHAHFNQQHPPILALCCAISGLFEPCLKGYNDLHLALGLAFEISNHQRGGRESNEGLTHGKIKSYQNEC